ncbi:sensor histidine kinase [Streptomyces radicis]|uniref:histidine kinase n=1 Tax=Streptomyces radicis TaxID=1750517 RepID=A0A3A9WAP0_9ACTN|nr:histidine kinase [Streptomyces radicis]RKN06454.1 sensor histidine kinase [Streptomyces radicis]RKN20287.1 sensor histidine kinase [Streptomyces radicis]
MGQVARRWALMAAGLACGTATAVLDVAALLVGALPGRAGTAVPARVAAWERARVVAFLGGERPPQGAVVERRAALAYLAVRWAVGLLGGLVLLSVLVGAAYGSFLVWLWFFYLDRWWLVAPSGVGGVFLIFLAAYAVFAVAALETAVARRFLGPGREEVLERRIRELAESRAGVVEAVHDERRRIERDLHDGVQQRLVALGMLLGRARRRGDEGGELLAQAHQEARQALTELRDVAWRVYPAVLDEDGLRAALEAVAERSPLPVRLAYRVGGEPPRAVAAVTYFTVSEAVTNAVKHSGAGTIGVEVTDAGGGVDVRVTDDGVGGADPAGGGLLGLARRVAALDGRLSVSSPPGGPTVIGAELPCA